MESMLEKRKQEESRNEKGHEVRAQGSQGFMQDAEFLIVLYPEEKSVYNTVKEA